MDGLINFETFQVVSFSLTASLATYFIISLLSFFARRVFGAGRRRF